MPPEDPIAPAPRPSPPPRRSNPFYRFARRARGVVERFLQVEAASGVVLLAAAAIALAWANSSWAASYARLWAHPIGLSVGGLAFARPLAWYIDDGLMTVFFFVVGLEIRRELHHGELSDRRRAALPAVAALGGMVVPALVYLAIAGAPPTRRGWGVPTATDIAFAVGCIVLLGRRVPAALRVLLLALAVIDDLGAIVVIALFYSRGVDPRGLLVAAAGLGGIFAMRSLGVRRPLAYVAPALLVWAGTYAAGIHPTIAGVVVGLVTPVRADSRDESTDASSPAEGLIEALHPWVAFAIMPLFALANAGVSLRGLSLDGPGVAVASGVALGLVVGKPVGVVLASAVALRLGVATLPRGIGARHLALLGVVAGIGFTMALFVARLAFTDPAMLNAAKLGVLAASAAAGVMSLCIGRWLLRVEESPEGSDPRQGRSPRRHAGA